MWVSRLMKHPVYGVRQMFGTPQMSSRNPKLSEYAQVNFKMYLFMEATALPHQPNLGILGTAEIFKI